MTLVSPEAIQRFQQYQDEYRRRPEVKARRRSTSAAWLQRPDVKERRRALRNTAAQKLNRAAAKRRYNRENRAALQEILNRRYQTDPIYKLRRLLRGRLWLALRGKSIAGSGVRDLGCSVADFKTYIEKLFQPGMEWSNWGEWHLDHIKPLASFDLADRSQLLAACHYTNFQPLWKKDNLSKGSRHGF